jgi:carbon monoxide dehydrogenase subunit G
MSMELDNSFTVPVPPDRAWDVLLDVERIAPCMPGATVDQFDGEVVTGRIKVKVGPVSLTYRGTAKFTERDPEARMVVVEASGKEMRGAGTASASVRASLEPEESGDATRVNMHTTMNVTGRPAQFGRGVIVEVGGKLVDQFAQNLAKQITGDNAEASGGSEGNEGTTTGGQATQAVADAAGQASATADGTAGPAGSAVTESAATAAQSAATAAQSAATAAQSAAHQPEEALNLVRLVGPALLKRVVPVAAAVAGVVLLGRRLRRVFRRGKA